MRKQIITFQTMLAFLILFGSAYAQRNFHRAAMTVNGEVFEVPNYAKATKGTPMDLSKDYLFFDDFSSGNIDNWTAMGDGIENWGVDQTNFATGTAPELGLHYSPVFTGYAYLTSPVINTTGYTELGLQFKHLIDNWSGGGGVYFRVYTTSDGGTTWNEVWSHFLEGPDPYGPELASIIINNSDIGSANFQFAFGFDDNSDLMDDWLIDDVTLGEPADLDVGVTAINGIPDLFGIGEDVTALANVQNAGSETVSFDVDLEIDDGSNVVFSSTQTVSDLEGGEQTTVAFDTWATSAVGVYTATVTTLLSGDVNPDNDVMTFTFSVIDGVTRNMVIVEDFTGTWCGFCPGAAMGISDLIENGYSIGPIAYHNGDPYETTESMARIDYYGITGFPTVNFDGIEQYSGGSSTQSMYDIYWPIIEARMAIPTPLTIDLENVSFNGTTFTADVVCEAVSSIASDDLVVHAVLTESHIDEAWVTQFELNEVERLMYNGAEGTPIDLINNTQQTVSIEFTLDGTWIPELCEVVVFVQDVSSKEIFNGDKVHVSELTELPDAIVTVLDNYGSPVENATVDFGEFQETTNASGQVVFPDIEPGVYWYSAYKDGYLPGIESYTVMQAENKELASTLSAANLLSGEDFASGFPPEGWTIEGDQIDNWTQSQTNYAGGGMPELQFSWSPQFIGFSDVISPFFDITSATNAHLMMKNYVDVYSDLEVFTLHIMATHDGTNWETLWEMLIPIDMPAEQLSFELSEEYLTAGQVQVKFHFEGDSYEMNNWNIDDVWIVEQVITSVGEKALDNILIFPNPAKDVVRISNVDQGSIYIYNINGQLVIEKQNVKGGCILDISNMENGTYIVKVITDTKTMTSKLNIIK